MLAASGTHADACCCCLRLPPHHHLQMKHCTTITLRPRTMDELTDLAALLLVHNTHHFPSLTWLRIEMLVGCVCALLLWQ